MAEEPATIDAATGFTIDVGWQETRANCTPCHSAALVTQNRMNREGWQKTIRWMQKKHNLWALGEHEALILDYLARHYDDKPSAKYRRAPLAISDP